MRLLRLPRALALGAIAALLDAALALAFVFVALPSGLLWRLLSPHPSWRRAARSRWEAPDPGRDPSRLDQASRQY